jgi:hypothetical protein
LQAIAPDIRAADAAMRYALPGVLTSPTTLTLPTLGAVVPVPVRAGVEMRPPLPGLAYRLPGGPRRLFQCSPLGAGGISNPTRPARVWRHHPTHDHSPVPSESGPRAAGTLVRSGGGPVGSVLAVCAPGVSAAVDSLSATLDPPRRSGLVCARPRVMAPAPVTVTGLVSACGGAIPLRSRSCGGAA